LNPSAANYAQQPNRLKQQSNKEQQSLVLAITTADVANKITAIAIFKYFDFILIPHKIIKLNLD
jgi:hypothetical protein